MLQPPGGKGWLSLIDGWRTRTQVKLIKAGIRHRWSTWAEPRRKDGVHLDIRGWIKPAVRCDDSHHVKLDDLDVYKFELLGWTMELRLTHVRALTTADGHSDNIIGPGWPSRVYCAWVISSIYKLAPLLYLNAVENLFIDWHLNWAHQPHLSL